MTAQMMINGTSKTPRGVGHSHFRGSDQPGGSRSRGSRASAIPHRGRDRGS